MRGLLTLLVSLLLVLLQGTVVQLLPLRAPAPALGMVVAMHVGISTRWTLGSAVVVSFCSGYVFDLVSGAPRGAHALVFVITTLAGTFWAQRLSLRGTFQKAAASFVVALVGALMLVAVRMVVAPEGGRPSFTSLRLAPLEALLTALAGPLVLRLLDRIDGRLGPRRGRHMQGGLSLG